MIPTKKGRRRTPKKSEALARISSNQSSHELPSKPISAEGWTSNCKPEGYISDFEKLYMVSSFQFIKPEKTGYLSFT
jgi:hypothetical protein